MSEVLKVEWYDLADAGRDAFLAWCHDSYLPALQAARGVSWVGHYAIVDHGDQPLHPEFPTKMETDDPAVPPGHEYVILTAAPVLQCFFGPDNAVDALEAAQADRLAERLNYRSAVFIEEERIDGPEQRAMPYGSGPPHAMQIGNYNTVSPDDDIELAKWYRAERFHRLSVSEGLIRGRKMVSVAGWPKHGVLWECTSLEEDETSFEHRFVNADRGENWEGRHVLEYVVHAPHGPHAGRRIWPVS
jgi:hypothetical protein